MRSAQGVSYNMGTTTGLEPVSSYPYDPIVEVGDVSRRLVLYPLSYVVKPSGGCLCSLLALVSKLFGFPELWFEFDEAIPQAIQLVGA